MHGRQPGQNGALSRDLEPSPKISLSRRRHRVTTGRRTSHDGSDARAASLRDGCRETVSVVAKGLGVLSNQEEIGVCVFRVLFGLDYR